MKENNYNTSFAFKPAGKQKVNIHDVSDDIKEELREFIDNSNKTFKDVLFEYIEKYSKTNPEVYNEAGLDRREFSSIKCKDHVPSKDKIVCLAIALKLDVSETINLLNAGGYTLSENINRDKIILFCIEQKLNIEDTNELLIYFDEDRIWKYD